MVDAAPIVETVPRIIARPRRVDRHNFGRPRELMRPPLHGVRRKKLRKGSWPSAHRVRTRDVDRYGAARRNSAENHRSRTGGSMPNDLADRCADRASSFARGMRPPLDGVRPKRLRRGSWPSARGVYVRSWLGSLSSPRRRCTRGRASSTSAASRARADEFRGGQLACIARSVRCAFLFFLLTTISRASSRTSRAALGAHATRIVVRLTKRVQDRRQNFGLWHESSSRTHVKAPETSVVERSIDQRGACDVERECGV